MYETSSPKLIIRILSSTEECIIIGWFSAKLVPASDTPNKSESYLPHIIIFSVME